MTNPDSKSQSAAPTIAALVLVALVPAICVLWFMTVAMRNERLATQERLGDLYLTQMSAVQRQLAAFWAERTAALATAAAGDGSGAEKFAVAVRAKLADGVVLYDRAGKAVYPETGHRDAPAEEKADWAAARELEFQKKDFAAAAEAYARIAGAARDVHTKARAMQAEAGCRLKAGNSPAAIARLTELASDPALRKAANSQGALIGPNAQLLILKLVSGASVGPPLAGSFRPTGSDEASQPRPAEGLAKAAGPLPVGNSTGGGTPAQPSPEATAGGPSGGPTTGLRKDSLEKLVARLNDYTDTDFPASQRRFLMSEVKALGAGAASFPTLAAEELAAEYLEHTPTPPTEAKLQRSPLAKVWQLTTANRSVVALFREETLKAVLAAQIRPLALADAQITVVAPGEDFTGSKLVPPQDAGEHFPGWRLALSFKGVDPLAAASARQTRFYLWTGFVVVVIIATVAWLVARYVAAQMRLARLKNELVSTVSHELKTPLASMRALVDTLSAGRYRNEQQLRDYLDLIAKENLRLSSLIENFLTFSRLEKGRQQFRFEALEPARVMDDAVEALHEKLRATNCSFAQQVEPGLPRIRGDADALSTVLINLLDNAWKYTDAEKRISARAYANNGHVCFEVVDNGIGIDRGEAKKIFDRFYQVDQSLTRQRGGCGLGLGIVQYIVRAHDGAVQVESELGKGSTFRVSIPCEHSTLNA